VIDAIPPAAAPPSQRDTPQKIHKTAQDFEALLIGQVLKGSREAGSGWLGTGDDEGGQIGMEVAEQEFARMLASQGGLGMSRLIEAGLKSKQT
jgi:Rod binding domain-containing protein